MSNKHTPETLQAEIDELLVLRKKLDRKIQAKCNKLDSLLIERNRDNFGDFEWLLNNPDVPGQWEAMRDWVGSRFGDEYSGVLPSGYYRDINQQAFSISLGYEHEDSDKRQQKIANVKAFLSEYVHMMKPSDGGFVSFTYATGQWSGIFDLAYRPDTETWWTTNVQYSRMVDKTQHDSLDAAIDAAIVIQAGIDD